MRKIFLSFWPILFIFSVWFIFASPYFIKGLIPYPAKYQVTFFHPWSVYEKWWGPVKNNAMPDVITQIYPWKHFTVNWLKQGQIPFWNPYSFSGNPHVGNFQSAVFSPFNLLFFILPFIDAWSMVVLLQPLLSGMFTYLFLREIQNNVILRSKTEESRSFVDTQDDSNRISKFGALIGSITFMFCGFNVVWMAYGTLTMAIAYLPLALFGIEKSFNTGKKAYLLILTLSIVFSFFSGHVQTSFYLLFFTIGYLTLKYLFFRRDKVTIFWSLLFFLLGIAVSLIQIYPAYELYLRSVRSNLLYSGGGIPWHYLVTLFSPDFYGNPVTRNDWFGTYAEWSGFVGIIPLILAVLAIRIKSNKTIIFFAISAIISLLLAIDSPLHNVLIASKIPILATSIPSRIIVLFSFSIAVLAGFGFDRLRVMAVKQEFKKIVSILFVFGTFIVLIWGILLLSQVLPPDKAKIAIKNLLLPSALFISTFFLVIINKYFFNKSVFSISLFALLILAGFDSLRFAGKWMPFDAREYIYPEVPVIKAIQQNIGFGRVFGNIGNEVTSYYGLQSTEGYDPLYIGRYGEFIRFAGNGEWGDAERSVARLNRRGIYASKVLDILGVTVVFHPIADTNTSWAYPVWDTINYSLLYHDDKFQLFRNNDALPRVKLYFDYEVISDKKAILRRMYSNEFNFREKLILEKTPSPVTSKAGKNSSGIFPHLAAARQNDNDEAVIVSYTPNKVIITVNTDKPALLFLSDNYYPHWTAFVDGKQVEIYRADYTFRAITVPQGKSRVEFVYQEYLY